MTRHLLGPVIGAVVMIAAAACATSEARHTASAIRPSVSGRDRPWLAEIHQANLAEIQVGELARKKGTTTDVRAAGAMLVTDHVSSDSQVTRVAKSLGITLPSSATPADAAAASRLAGETGARFNQDFLSTMTAGHEKAIGDTQAEISRGSLRQVRSLAQSTLPVLRKHLRTLRRASATG